MKPSEQTEDKEKLNKQAHDTEWNELKEYIKNGDEDGVAMILTENAAFNTAGNISRVLHIAVAANRENIVTLAINKGADINAVDENGDSPLHIAVRQIHCGGLVQRFISLNAKRNIRNENNDTPLDIINEALRFESKPIRKEKLISMKALFIEDTEEKYKKNYRQLSKSTSNSELMFECSKGLKVNLTGAMFQTQIIMLFAKRAMDRGCEFRLATEIESAGKFDDVVLRYEENGRIVYRFVQAKHRDNPSVSTIRELDLFSSDMKGEFNIVKYFISFIKILNSTTYQDGVLDDFIICTNTDLDKKAKEHFTCKDLLCNDFMYLNKCAGKKYLLKCENNNKNIINYLIRKMKCIALDAINLKAIEIIKEDKIRAALQTQLELINNECDDALWTFERIKREGSKIFDNYLSVLAKHKKSIQNAVDGKGKTASETITEIFPIDGEEPCLSGDLKQLKASASSIIHEHSQKVKNQKGLLLDCCMDDNLIETRINEFMDKFGIVTNYPGINELNDLISHELGREFKLHDASFLHDSFEKDMLKWVRSYESNKAKYFLGKDGEEIFINLERKLNTLFISGASKWYVDQIRQYNIFFEQDDSVMEFLLKDENILHVVTEHTRLSALKIVRSLEQNIASKRLDSVLFVSIKSIEPTDMCQQILNAFGSNSSHHILVIECQKECQEQVKFDQFVCDINKILNTNDNKKLILIASERNVFAEKFKTGKYSYAIESIRLHDLAREARKAILDKDIVFLENRGISKYKIQLKDLMDEHSADGIIDEEMLWWLIKNNNVRVGDDRAFNSEEYNENYNIRRRIQHQTIDFRVLFKIRNVLVFVTGPNDKLKFIYRNMKENLRISRVNVKWWEKIATKHIDIGSYSLVVLSKNEDQEMGARRRFELVCQQYPNVHWLTFSRNSMLLWKDFKGSAQLLDDELTENFTNNEFQHLKIPLFLISTEHRNWFEPKILKRKVIILADDPGEGKSTMLTGLAYDLKKMYPLLWIVRINLAHHTEKGYAMNLKDIEIEDGDTEKGIDILGEMIVRGDPNDVNVKFQRELVKATLNGHTRTKLMLLVDGFDTIAPNYKEKFCTLLKILKESNIFQLWVTTRKESKTYLENALQTPAYVMVALTNKEQVGYLNRYWEWYLTFYKNPQNETNAIEIQHHLYKFQESISQFLRDFSTVNKDIRERINELCTKLYEIIQDTDAELPVLQEKIQELDFSAYAEIVLDAFKDFRSSEIEDEAFTTVPQNLRIIADIMFKQCLKIPKSSSLYGLYRQFVMEKFDIYQQMNATSNDLNIIVQEQCKREAWTLHKAHGELAIKLLFPNSFKKIDNALPQFTNDEWARIGLVRTTRTGLEFIHRTDAEYFLSEYLFHNFDNEVVQKEVFIKIITNIDHRGVRKFFNSLLLSYDNLDKIKCVRAPFRDSLLNAVLVNWRPDGPTPLSVAASEGNVGLLKLIFIIFDGFRTDGEKTVQSEDLFEHLILLKGKEQRIALHAAMPNGDVARVLLERAKRNDYVFREFLLAFDVHGQSALHFISSGDVIKTVLELVQPYENLHKRLLLHTDKKERTALHTAVLNKEVVEALVESTKHNPKLFKQLVLTVDSNRQSALHHATNGEIVRIILQAAKLDKDLLEQLLLLKDNRGRTALHAAMLNEQVARELLESAKVSPDVLKKLLLSVDDRRQSVVHYFAIGEVLKMILEIVQLNKPLIEEFLLLKDMHGRTALHMAMFYEGIWQRILERIKRYPELYQHFLLSKSVNNSALHFFSNEEVMKIVLKVIEPEIDLEQFWHLKKNLGRATLHVSMLKEASYNLLKNAKEYPELFKNVVLSVDVHGHSALHYLANKHMIKNMLDMVKANEDVFEKLLLLKDKMGRTALHLSMRKKELAQALLENLKTKQDLFIRNILTVDTHGKSPLHYIDDATILNAVLETVRHDSELLERLLLIKDGKDNSVLRGASRIAGGGKAVMEHVK